MLFNSYEFIIYFFPVCLLISLLIRKFISFKYYIIFLIAASLFFYAQNNALYLLLIIVSIIGNFRLGKLIENTARKRQKKIALITGVVVNIGALFYFKYTNFLINIFNTTTKSEVLYEVALPIGISFYTFQQIMYLVDTYKNKVTEHNFFSYALYISFFPQLIAGPIVHQKNFLAQFYETSKFTKISSNLAIGLSFFTYGLFKKVVIADNLENLFVNPVFEQASSGPLTFWEAWAGAVAYAFQIYYDFSGYSDMAFGLGKCFGIELPINFNSPYKSKNIREFWRRWHITLSFFLRDYLFIPLGGSRVSSAFRKYFNLVLTMFLAGLWHGAGWGFMIWGLMHGIGLAVNHWSKEHIKIKLHPAILWSFTFSFICICWVPFKAETMSTMTNMWFSMANLTSALQINTMLYNKLYLILLPILLFHCTLCPNLFQIFKNHFNTPETLEMLGEQKSVINLPLWKPCIFWAIITACVLYISFLFLGSVNSFIYFQF